MLKRRLCAVITCVSVLLAGCMPVLADDTGLISFDKTDGIRVTSDNNDCKPGQTVSFGLDIAENYVMRGLEIITKSGKPVEFDVIGSYRYSFILPFEGVNIRVRSEDHKIVSRAEAVKALWELAGSPASELLPGYTDVSVDAEYYGAVRWAAEIGLINRGERFNPDMPIIREELAAILFRYAGRPELKLEAADSALLDAVDKDFISEWAYLPVCWSVVNRILDAESGAAGYFKPQEQMTRFDLKNALENLKKVLAPEEPEPAGNASCIIVIPDMKGQCGTPGTTNGLATDAMKQCIPAASPTTAPLN